MRPYAPGSGPLKSMDGMDGEGGSHGLAASARSSCRAGEGSAVPQLEPVAVRLWAAFPGEAEYAA